MTQLKVVGSQVLSVMVYACLTVGHTIQTETKVGHSDPGAPRGKGSRSTDQRYAGGFINVVAAVHTVHMEEPCYPEDAAAVGALGRALDHGKLQSS